MQSPVNSVVKEVFHSLVCLQMPTQFMMAVLFCTCDSILNFQNIYYTYWSRSKGLRALQQESQQQTSHKIVAEANELEALLSTTMMDTQAKSRMLPSPLVPPTSSSSSNNNSSNSSSSSSGSGTLPANPYTPSSPAAVRRLQGLSAGMGTATHTS